MNSETKSKAIKAVGSIAKTLLGLAAVAVAKAAGEMIEKKVNGSSGNADKNAK